MKNKGKHRWIPGLCLALLLAIAVLFQTGAFRIGKLAEKGESLGKITVILNQKNNLFWEGTWEGICAEAEEKGLAVSEYQLENEEAMAEYIEIAILSGSNAIIYNADKCAGEDWNWLRKAKEEGIYLIALDFDSPADTLRDQYIGMDNAASGVQVADYVAAKLKKAETEEAKAETEELETGAEEKKEKRGTETDTGAEAKKEERGAETDTGEEEERPQILLLNRETYISNTLPERFEAVYCTLVEAGLEAQTRILNIPSDEIEVRKCLENYFAENEGEIWVVSCGPAQTLSAARSIASDEKNSRRIHLVGYGETQEAEDFLQKGIIQALLVQENRQMGEQAVDTIADLLQGSQESVEEKFYIGSSLEEAQ